MTLIQLVNSVIGVIPSPYDFLTYIFAGVVFVTFVGLFLRFILGAISSIFYR